MSDAWMMFLEDVKDTDRDKVGSKAWNLALLKQSGFNVPNGFVITTDAFNHHLAGILDLGTRGDALTAQDVANDIQLEDDFVEMITQAMEKLNAGLVAVRSSATAEDLESASFAGQYDTYLGIKTIEALLEAITNIWASYFSQRARYYREIHDLVESIKSTSGGMAVLVQQQLDADVSGVMFTVNPLTGKDEDCLIEAAWGLGEGVVSGHVSPDRFVLNIFKGTIIKREVARKERKVVLDETSSGTKIVTVDESLQDLPSLDDDQLKHLAELGLAIQVFHGKPQDIEWVLRDGVFYVLQARPLTKIQFSPDFGQWTTANLREVHPPEGLTPFSREIFSDPFRWAMTALMIDIKLLGKNEPKPEWCTEFFGRCYWNVGMAKELASRIPGYNERIFDEGAGIEIHYEGDGKTTPWTLRTILRALPVLFALNKQYKQYADFARQHVQDFDERLKRFSSLTDEELSALPLEEFYQRFLDLMDFTLETDEIAMHVSFIGALALDDFKEKIHGINKSLSPEQQVDEGKLLTGLEGITTSDVLMDMWRLISRISKNQKAREVLVKNDAKKVLELLKQDDDTREVGLQIQAFIDKYPFIAAYDEEISCPRWHDQPWEGIALIQQHLSTNDLTTIDPREIINRQRQEREQEERRLWNLLSRGVSGKIIGWYRRRSFEKVLRTVQTYTILREATRLPVSKVFFHLRRYTLELGKRWKQLGYIDSEEDIFFLTYYTVKKLIKDGLSLTKVHEEIEYHVNKRKSFRNYAIPLTITGAVTIDSTSRVKGIKDKMFTGVGCSSGIVEGPVRIILSLEDGHHLQKGEILVTKFTNPGWTPLFSLASGVIIEEGGLLSHTAVIAREVGIPGVLQVRDATKILKNGQKVRIDGFRGIVELLD